MKKSKGKKKAAPRNQLMDLDDFVEAKETMDILSNVQPDIQAPKRIFRSLPADFMATPDEKPIKVEKAAPLKSKAPAPKARSPPKETKTLSPKLSSNPFADVPNIVSDINACGGLVNLSFRGTDLLTDAMFYGLWTQYGSSSCAKVVGLDLTGCLNVTDTGLKFISQLFPKLTSITLTGCEKVTETGLYKVVSECKSLNTLDISGTSVCVLPHKVSDLTISRSGFPSISPDVEILKQKDLSIMKSPMYAKPADKDLVKVCVIHKEGGGLSLVKYLNKEKDMTLGHLHSLANFPLNSRFTANVIECQEMTCDLFVTKRTLFMLTVSEKEDVKDAAKRILAIICHVLSKVHNAVFLLASLRSGPEVKVNLDLLKSQVSALAMSSVKNLEDSVKKLEKSLQGNKSGKGQEIMDEQWQLTSRLNLLYALKDLYLEYVDVEMWNAFKSDQSFIRDMATGLEKLCDRFPEYQQIADPVMKFLQSKKVDTMLQGMMSLETGRASNRKMMEMTAVMGRTVYAKIVQDVEAVCLVDWLSVVFNKSFNPPTTSLNQGKLRELPDTACVWETGELIEELKKLMPEEQARNGAILPAKLGFSFFKGIMPFQAIPEEPVQPLTQYFPELPPSSKQKDIFHTLGIKVTFESPVPTFILHKMLSLCFKVRQPHIVWQTGFIILEGFIETLVELRIKAKEEPCLLLYTHSVKNTLDEKFLQDILLNTLLDYKCILDFVLKSNNIPYLSKYECTPEQKKTLQTGVLQSRHMFQMVEDDDSKPVEPKICRLCKQPAKAVSLAWDLFRTVNSPTFTRDHIIKIEELEGVSVEGNILTMSKKNTVIIRTLISCSEQNTFKIGLLDDNTEHLSVGLGAGKTFLLVNLGNGKIIMDGKEVKQLAELQPAQLPKTGDTLAFTLKELDGNLKNAELRIYRGSELLKSLIVPYDSYSGVLRNDNDTAACIMMFPVLKMQPVVKLRPGMRLEAWDRKTPTLVCVATVEKINDNGTILIHFDGWGSNYDYIADPTSPDLHPIGWFDAHKGRPETSKYTQQLQKPNGYRKAFNWPQYLAENNFDPVPFRWFTQEQVGIATMDLEDKVSGFKGIPNDDKSETEGLVVACSPTTDRVRKFEAQSLNKCTMSPAMFNFFTNHSKFFCLLPAKMSIEKLRYPSLMSIMDGSQQNVHILCPGLKMELLHLVDHEGVPLPAATSIKEMATFLQNCYLGIILQDAALPKSCSKLLPGVKKMSDVLHEQVELWFKRLCFLYISMLEPLVQGNPNIPRSTLETYASTVSNKSVAALLSDTDSTYVRCKGHALSTSVNSELSTIPMETFSNLCHLISKLDFQNNKIEYLPDNIFESFSGLESLNLSGNNLDLLSEGMKNLSLVELDISSNKIKKLPGDFESQKDTLVYLNISDNPLHVLPKVIYRLELLEELHASNIGKVEDFKEIKNLKELQVLDFGYNQIGSIPDELGDLPLTSLNLSGVPWIPMATYQSYSAFSMALNANYMTWSMSDKEKNSLFTSGDVDESSTLTPDEIITLNNEQLFPKYPRLGVGSLNYPDSGGIPTPIFRLSKLKKLVLQYQGITSIPVQIKELTALSELNVSYNPKLVSVDAAVGGLPMRQLGLLECQALNTPPKEIVSRGIVAIMGYLKRLQLGASPCKRTKLMLVGLGGAGKTSLSQSLMNNRYRAYMDHDEPITDGIDISIYEVPLGDKDTLTFGVWDFAGQTVYYNTHQFFLSNRAVYLLLWNVRQGYEHAGLDFWLSSIACHAPKAPILVVGTHMDKVEKSKLPEESLKARYPQICGFSYVSSYTGNGIDDLRKTIISEALKQKYMGEQIPQAWLTLEKKLIDFRQNNNVDILPFAKLDTIAQSCGIFHKDEIVQAIQFLHDLGAVQFFNTDFLRDMVVIYPQWIIDVMACLVTVHQGAVNNGKLLLKDIGKVWKDYPTDLHPWLLRLTEEFDLTCQLPDDEASIVPCLLPDEEPEYSWPSADPMRNIHESLIMYKFQYLPAGLFNRAQVRLHEYSNGAVLWKKGSFMKKNKHIALMLQTDDQEVIVRAQGFRPENFLFIVHEMFETLITESYSGVRYDFLMPCTDCLSMNVKDPSMISHNKVKRGMELNVPFIQCDKFFHILSIQELKNAMPSDKMSDMDNHLQNSVSELIDLTQETTINCFLIYSSKNVPSKAEEGKLVHPDQILEDLRKDGSFKVSHTDKPETLDMEAMTLTMKSSEVIIIGMSDEFCNNAECQKLLLYIKDVLRKPVLLLLLGKTKAWQKGPLAMNFGTEVYVDMQNIQRYPHKIKELYEAIKKKAVTKKKVKEDLPNTFISYCWSNSHDAIAKGSRKHEGALGWSGGDPREVKKFLNDKGIQCWIDVERVGGVGLFHSIADGLREAELMIAFVSDEYVKSKNCVMEFRYALSTLRIPVIVVVVGTGYEWERSEVGLLAVGQKCKKVNLQYNNEAGYLELLAYVQQKLSKLEENKDDSESTDVQRTTAFQEVLELTQRKFLRHMMSAVISDTAEPYPCLIVVDFLSDKDRENLANLMKEKKLNQLKAQQAANKKEEEREGQKEVEEKLEKTDDDSSKKTDEELLEGEDFTIKSKFCFRLLCENVSGWHLTSYCLPFPDEDQSEEQQIIDSAAPYLGRVFTIAKYSNVQLECLTTPEGEMFLQRIEEIGLKSASDFKQEYQAFLAVAKEQDQNFSTMYKVPHLASELYRCYVNGKMVWLCKKHKKAARSKTEDIYENRLATANESIPLPVGDVSESIAEESLPQEPKQEPRQHRKIFNRSSQMKPKMIRQKSQMCSVM